MLHPIAENALRFLLKDRIRHGDIEAARSAQHHLNALDSETPEDKPQLVTGAGATQQQTEGDPAANTNTGIDPAA